MKKRYLHALLFGIPGVFIVGVILGVLWLFIFGDDPWPLTPETILSILLVLTFLILSRQVRIGNHTSLPAGDNTLLYAISSF
jgi:hypothetical protein